MRIAVAVGLAVAVTATAAASAHGSAHGVPRRFSPESAAAVGTRDLWVLGDYGCRGTWCHALLRSTDAGKHFSRVGLPSLPPQGTDPTVVFANARDGFVYVENGTPLYVTHDGGESWHRAGPARDVTAFAAAGGYAYVVTGRHRFERSPVAANAWRRPKLSVAHLPFSLAARGSQVWFLGPPRRRPDYDTLALSSDHGRTFTLRKGPCLAELGGTLVPAADGVVWAVCPSGMMAGLNLSKNGGLSFPSFHDPGGVHQPGLTNGAEIAATSPRGAVLYQGASGPLLRTSDGGVHWTVLKRTADLRDVFWLHFASKRDGMVLAETRSHPSRTSLLRTTDGGATWLSMPIR
jgi:photosystem II stability/assembly factor-like uncharacterized protein